MKAILKLIWFALVVVLIQKVGSQFLTTNNVGMVSDKLASFFPASIEDKLHFDKFFKIEAIKQLVFVIALFLGLDIISGDIKGIIKGPIKLAFNCVLYIIGFSLIFFILSGFSITI